MVVRGRGESSGDRLNQWAASQLVVRGSQVDEGEGRAHFVLALARVRRTMQLAPFRCADRKRMSLYRSCVGFLLQQS